MDNLIDGFTSKISDLVNTVKGAVEKVTNLLPGSEPKDPTSPLRGLGKRGEALLGNFRDGILAAAPDLRKSVNDSLRNLVDPTISAALSGSVDLSGVSLPSSALAGAGSTTTQHYNTSISAPGGGSPDPRVAVALLDQELRNRGGVGS
jgi:hypothetical protein